MSLCIVMKEALSLSYLKIVTTLDTCGLTTLIGSPECACFTMKTINSVHVNGSIAQSDKYSENRKHVDVVTVYTFCSVCKKIFFTYKFYEYAPGLLQSWLKSPWILLLLLLLFFTCINTR